VERGICPIATVMLIKKQIFALFWIEWIWLKMEIWLIEMLLIVVLMWNAGSIPDYTTECCRVASCAQDFIPSHSAWWNTEVRCTAFGWWQKVIARCSLGACYVGGICCRPAVLTVVASELFINTSLCLSVLSHSGCKFAKNYKCLCSFFPYIKCYCSLMSFRFLRACSSFWCSCILILCVNSNINLSV